MFERRPDPPPAKVNAVTLTITGTLVWAVATVVVALLVSRGAVAADLLDICFAGLAMGVLAIGWGYVHEHRARRRGPRPSPAPPAKD
jgi:hypothetical protein